MLVTGRRLYQFNAATMTRRTPHETLQPGDWLDIAPADAAGLGLAEGDRVRVRSRYGEALLPVHLDADLRGGELFTAFHTGEVLTNTLTSPHRDSYTDTPEYKVTAVHLERSRDRS